MEDSSLISLLLNFEGKREERFVEGLRERDREEGAGRTCPFLEDGREQRMRGRSFVICNFCGNSREHCNTMTENFRNSLGE